MEEKGSFDINYCSGLNEIELHYTHIFEYLINNKWAHFGIVDQFQEICQLGWTLEFQEPTAFLVRFLPLGYVVTFSTLSF